MTRPNPSPPTRARVQESMTAARKAAFIKALEQCGVVIAAARVASPHSRTGAVSSFRDAARLDTDFAADWADAQELANAKIELEMRRRAIEGDVVETAHGPMVKRSDRLLEVLARHRVPGFEKQLRVDARVDSDIQMVACQELSEGLEKLLPESRADLQRILDREAARTDLAWPDAGSPTIHEHPTSGG